MPRGYTREMGQAQCGLMGAQGVGFAAEGGEGSAAKKETVDLFGLGETKREKRYSPLTLGYRKK